MKKVRLFAVAAAMGMFASTVAAAEPVVSTSYNVTWGEVSEIVKVDVGDKVVAPTTTVTVIKETRTTDTEEKPYLDGLGFEDLEDCYTSTGVADDKNNDDYSDVQMYSNVNPLTRLWENGYWTSAEEAVKEYLADNHLVLAPGATEVEEGAYYAKYANKSFVDYEGAYAWLVEQGLFEEVYDEEGDLTKILVKPTVVTDKKGNELLKAHYEFEVAPRTEETVKENLVKAAVNGDDFDGVYAKMLKTYTKADETANRTYDYRVSVKDSLVASELVEKDGGIIIVDEYKGELVVVANYANDAAAATADEYHTGWTKDNDPIAPKGTEGKITVYEVASKKGEVVKIATIKPSKVKAYTYESEMVWDEVNGSFVKTENAYSNFTYQENVFWASKEYDENDNPTGNTFFASEMQLKANTLGLTFKPESVENTSDKWLLNVDYVAVNTKKEQVTLAYDNGDKEVVVPAVEVSKNVWMPAFDSEETLVKVATKILEGKAAVKFDKDTEYYNDPWYIRTTEAMKDVWSGYTFDGEMLDETGFNGLRGTGSEACAYVVAETSEEVEATITSDADSIDTSKEGIKTLTLSAKVGDEVVSTKEVKVVVAPKYQRQYVGGKVAVLKAFHLNGNLYAEYHYDWTAKTYTATFYAQDGVTVASTANGTL